MTAEAFAQLVQARPTGKHCWQAKCPAHRDKSPSLAVKQGRDGRVLVRCWAGCVLESILSALKLTMRDLFNTGEPMTSAQISEARKERTAQETEAKQQAAMKRRSADIYRRLGVVIVSLGARLAHAPDGPGGDALAETYHRAVRLRAEIEDMLGNYGAPPMQLAISRADVSPFDRPEPEALEARKVATEAHLLQYLGTGHVGPQVECSDPAARPSTWQWNPPPLPDESPGDSLLSEQLTTLAEFDDLCADADKRSDDTQTKQSPARNGALKRSA